MSRKLSMPLLPFWLRKWDSKTPVNVNSTRYGATDDSITLVERCKEQSLGAVEERGINAVPNKPHTSEVGKTQWFWT
jgi:hypothetical protein